MFTRVKKDERDVADRHDFLRKELSRIAPGKLLDMGSGERPYENLIKNLGFSYTSHDFEKYEGSDEFPGLQNTGWENKNHDIVCDILEIPTQAYDVIVLTEVLEHVPDPVAVLNKCYSLLDNEGRLIVTVPFASRMHQAPFWFSSGLSPFWFDYHGKSLGYEVEKCCLLGNFYDMFLAEGEQFFGCFGIKSINLGTLFQATFIKLRRILEPRVPGALLDSGAMGVFVVLAKK